MIERIRTHDKKKVEDFYNRIYEAGGYFSEETFNRRAMKILGISSREKSRMLDVACGQGTLLAMAEKYVETYGIDISRTAIRKAEKIAKNTKFRIAQADELPFRKRMFDYVTCMGSLEHFPNIEKALGEMSRVAKKDARILIHVPNSKYLVHMILGIDTQGQINERLATEDEWKKLIGKYFKIKESYKYNTKWFLKWIPKKHCCHFTFLCHK